MKSYLKKIYKKFVNFLHPKVLNNFDYKIRHYGTFYGGYDIVDREFIKTVISCGLGEDASFDVELINSKDCIVYAIDPTPRSINYYNNMKKQFGKSKSIEYSNHGFQKVQAYDLQKINSKNFILIQKAIFDSTKKKLKLYFPNNKQHVSASIDKNSNNPNEFFYADVITIDEIISKHNIEQIDILKLDIEGAEITILKDILAKKIFPKQILVEYTNKRSKNLLNQISISIINKKLIENNYVLVNENKKGDFTYLLMD